MEIMLEEDVPPDVKQSDVVSSLHYKVSTMLKKKLLDSGYVEEQ